MKIVFLGTPDFAAGALEALITAGHEITAVVTQPDKAKGRSKELLPPPVKECAIKHGIPVLQPARIKRPEAVEELRAYPADIYIVAAFGQLLSQEILDIPKYGSLNIHASLLPKYRGASPIQHVIIDGEKETGVTIMQMDATLDTGDMLYKKSVPIEDNDTFETLHDKLMALGGQAIVEALALLEEGKLTPEKQDDSLSCYAPLIQKSMGELDFTKSAAALERLVRGMNPWPSAYTYYHGKQLKVWKAAAEGIDSKEVQETEERQDLHTRLSMDGEQSTLSGQDMLCMPGEITEVARDYIRVSAGEGSLCIYELQLEGKKRMSTRDFLLGVKMAAGERLGKK